MANKNQYFTMAFILMFLLFSIMFNRDIIEIRLDEANYLLHNASLDDFASRTFSIVSKYELIRRRIESDSISNDEHLIEGRIQATISENLKNVQPQEHEGKLSEYPVNAILKVLRFFLGKPPLIKEVDVKIYNELEQGYYLERIRSYQEALDVYDSILLNQELGTKMLSSILLHKAFCLSMLGEYNNSAKIYETVVTLYNETPEGALAQKLLDFVLMIQKENSQIKHKKRNTYEIGKSLYTYMDYRGAVKELATYLEDENALDKNGAHFYKGRAHEELGEYNNAVDEYKTVMYLGEENGWAQKANRRLVLLGEIYEHHDITVIQAKEILKSQGDTLFIQEMQELGKLVEVPQIVKELKKSTLIDSVKVDSTPEIDSAFIKDSIRAAEEELEKIELARKGEDERRRREIQRQKQIDSEKQKKELERQKQLAFEKQKEKAFERRKLLSASEFRNSTFIRGKIETNISELKDTYLRYIQSGKDIEGKIVIEMIIAPSGRNSAKIISSSIQDKRFNRDILKQVKSWKFPPVDDSLGDLTISYPFYFTSEE